MLIEYSPLVEFCGYTIPHPSEDKMNLRVQTAGTFSHFHLLIYIHANDL